MFGSIQITIRTEYTHTHAHGRAATRVCRVPDDIHTRRHTAYAHQTKTHKWAHIQMWTVRWRVRVRDGCARSYAHCAHGLARVWVSGVRCALWPRRQHASTLQVEGKLAFVPLVLTDPLSVWNSKLSYSRPTCQAYALERTGARVHTLRWPLSVRQRHDEAHEGRAQSDMIFFVKFEKWKIIVTSIEFSPIMIIIC
jgi:hypothetical protein